MQDPWLWCRRFLYGLLWLAHIWLRQPEPHHKVEGLSHRKNLSSLRQLGPKNDTPLH